MSVVTALNGRNISKAAVAKRKQYYTLYDDETLQYNAAGMNAFSGLFRDHSVDIRKIETEADHDLMLDICANEAIGKLESKDSFGRLQADLLKAVMFNPDNEEAQRIQRKIDVHERVFLVTDQTDQ